MKKLILVAFIFVATVSHAATLHVELECDGKWIPTPTGYECGEGGPVVSVVGVDLKAEPGLKVEVKRRATDISKVIRVEVSKSTPIRLNGVLQP